MAHFPCRLRAPVRLHERLLDHLLLLLNRRQLIRHVGRQTRLLLTVVVPQNRFEHVILLRTAQQRSLLLLLEGARLGLALQQAILHVDKPAEAALRWVF